MDIDGPVWSIVVAGGSGHRFGELKQFATIAGKRVIDWSMKASLSVSDGLVLVVPAGTALRNEPLLDEVVFGGATRSESVRSGLAAVPDDAAIIVIHDAARPAAGPEIFESVVRAVRLGAAAAVPGVPVVDSMRLRSGGVVERGDLVAVQTPQAFRADLLREAHSTGAEATDDAALVEALGEMVEIVEGDPRNIKLTVATDALILERHLAGVS